MAATLETGYPASNSAGSTAQPSTVAVTLPATSAGIMLVAVQTLTGAATHGTIPSPTAVAYSGGGSVSWTGGTTRTAFGLGAQVTAKVWYAWLTGAISSQAISFAQAGANDASHCVTVYGLAGASSTIGAEGGGTDATAGGVLNTSLTATGAGSFLCGGAVHGNTAGSLTARGDTTIDRQQGNAGNGGQHANFHLTAATSGSGSVTFGCTDTDGARAHACFEVLQSSNPSGTVAVTQANQTSTAVGDAYVDGDPLQMEDATTLQVEDAETLDSEADVSGATGTVAATQDAQTSTAAGTPVHVGTVAVAQAAQTSTASGTPVHFGTAAATQADQTSTASGVVGDITGTVAVTQAAQTSAAAGTPVTVGASAQTQADQASSAAGWANNISGAVAATQAAQTSTAAGSPVCIGTLAETQDAQTSTASGGTGAILRMHSTFPAAPQSGYTRVFSWDDSVSQAIHEDTGAGKNLFVFTHCWDNSSVTAATGDYRLWVSTDKGANWTAIAQTNSEPAFNSSPHYLATAQDSTGELHVCSHVYGSTAVQYSRIAFARDGSGHITGWSWEAQYVAVLTFSNPDNVDMHITLRTVVDANAVERLLLTVYDTPGNTDIGGTGVGGRLLASVTSAAAGLAPSGTSSWVKLTNNATTGFDVLGAWSTNGTTDANALRNFTSQSGYLTGHGNQATAGQVGSSGDIIIAAGGYYYTDLHDPPGAIYLWRLTPSGSSWANDAGWNGDEFAADGATLRPTLGAAVSREDKVYIPYSDSSGGITIGTLDASGAASTAFASLDSGTSGRVFLVAIGVSVDETRCWAGYYAGRDAVAQVYFRTAYHDGASWTTYDDDASWVVANWETTSEEPQPWWSSRNLTNGVVVASYPYTNVLGGTPHTIHTQAVYDSTALSTVTGTVAETQDAQTSSAAGTPVTVGSSAVSQASQTSTASGTTSVVGTSAQTQGAQTSTASGTPVTYGSSATTQADQTCAASGTVVDGTTGTVAVTQASQTSTASGTPVHVGTVAYAQAAQTSTASGWPVPVGTVSATQAPQTSTASGWPVPVGTAAATQAAQTSTASGFPGVEIVGTVAATQASQACLASGFPVFIAPRTSRGYSRDGTTATEARQDGGTASHYRKDGGVTGGRCRTD